MPHLTSPLEDHMLYFANAEGYVDEKSIYLACRNKLHMTESGAKNTAFGTMFGAWFQKVPGMSFSVRRGVQGRFRPKDALGLLTHPHDTGFYDRENGSFNEELFQLLESYAIQGNHGEHLVSRDIIEKFINERNKNDNRWDNARWYFKKLGEVAHRGEFELLFSLGANRFILNTKTGQLEGYVTVDALKEFYRDSPGFFNKIRALADREKQLISDPEISPAQSDKDTALYEKALDKLRGYQQTLAFKNSSQQKALTALIDQTEQIKTTSPAHLPVLTAVLLKTIHAIENPHFKESYQAYAKKLQGKPSPLLQGLGIAMASMGAIFVILGALAVPTPAGIGLMASGGALILAGFGLFAHHRQKGLSKAVNEMAERIEGPRPV